VFIGHYADLDVYVCQTGAPGGDSLLARYGNESYEYSSTPLWLWRDLVEKNNGIGLDGGKAMPFRDYLFSHHVCPHHKAWMLALAIHGQIPRRPHEARTYKSQFPAEYDVPAVFDALKDNSWGNDVCPTFTLASDDKGLETWLWVEHPLPSCREGFGKRFNITREDENGDHFTRLFESDSLEETVAFIQKNYGLLR
jgi:hypothetical protein